MIKLFVTLAAVVVVSCISTAIFVNSNASDNRLASLLDNVEALTEDESKSNCKDCSVGGLGASGCSVEISILGIGWGASIQCDTGYACCKLLWYGAVSAECCQPTLF